MTDDVAHHRLTCVQNWPESRVNTSPSRISLYAESFKNSASSLLIGKSRFLVADILEQLGDHKLAVHALALGLEVGEIRCVSTGFATDSTSSQPTT